MDKKKMVEKLLNLARRVKLEKGPLSLLMLLKETPDSLKWSLIISATWLNEVPPSSVLPYWIELLISCLDQSEQAQIARISIIKTNDPFISQITSLMRVSDSVVEIKNTLIGELVISEAIIFEANKPDTDFQNNTSNRIDRNPTHNHSINPTFNHSINPIYNHSINPIYNHSINPTYNYSINPIYNNSINPAYNLSINPTYNHSINPIYNHSINPTYNHSLNPTYNRGFNELQVFNTQGIKIGYILSASDGVRLIFNTSNTYLSYAVSNGANGYNVFNDHTDWIGYIVPSNEYGYNYFSTSNEWIWFII